MGYNSLQEALPSVYRPQVHDRVRWFHLLPLLLVLPYLKQSLDGIFFPKATPAFIIECVPLSKDLARRQRRRTADDALLAASSRGLSRCAELDAPAAFRAHLASETRTENDRFVPGTPAVLLQNATLWTGLQWGNEVIHEGAFAGLLCGASASSATAGLQG